MTPLVVVCGACGGIGSAVVQRFQRRGWTVVGVDRRPVHGGVVADLSDAEGLARIVEAVPARDRVQAVVNCVGEQLVQTVAETTVDDWDRVFASNARAAFLVTKLGVELMQRHGTGSIVHVASVHAQVSSPGMAAYAASKGAVVSFARAAAVELAPIGLRVNVVAPGAVDTPMLHRGIEERADLSAKEGLARVLARTPLARLADPDDIAAAIEFLADPERAAFVTGQVLVVDGGVTAVLATE